MKSVSFEDISGEIRRKGNGFALKISTLQCRFSPYFCCHDVELLHIVVHLTLSLENQTGNRETGAMPAKTRSHRAKSSMFPGHIPQPSMQYDPISGIYQTAQSQPDPSHLAAPVSNDLLTSVPDQPPQKLLDQAVRGTWTHQEDELLTQAVTQLGPTKWMHIAKFVPSRTSKQCRERWYNRLSPSLRRDPFDPWEDQIIIAKQAQLGNRWALIAQSLPGRSPDAVKNRWYAGLRTTQDGPDAELVTGRHTPA
jgi:hypothetical protein